VTLRRAIIAAALALAWPTAATAATEAGPASRSVEATAADLLVMAARLAEHGETRQARRILVLLGRDPSREMRNEARYRHALLLETAGEVRPAAVLLRAILDEAPNAAPVRLKLAALLHQLGDQEAALQELRALRSARLPPDVARFVDRVAASLQNSKPFGVHLEFALAPDSNINRATRSDSLGTIFGEFTFDEEAKPVSGVGAAIRAGAHRRFALGGDASLVARATTDLNLFRDSRFNDFSAELSAGPELIVAGMRVTAEAGIGQRWYGMKAFQRQLRLSGTVTRPLDSRSQARLEASLRLSDALLNDLQDGRGVTLRSQYQRALSPTMAIAASLTHDRFVATDKAYSTRSWTAALSAHRDLGRMSVSIGAEFGRLEADDRLAILPEARKDRLRRLTFGTSFRQLTVMGFAPTIRLVIERNRSNVEFYDYRRTRTEFGVTRAF
jgi:tetratricopeptide (TPR) repeat protein